MTAAPSTPSVPSPAPRAARSLVVVGASAGGVDALKRLLAGLPADLDAAVCVALHLGSTASSVLPEILSRVCRLEVVAAEEGAVLVPGRVHVARPDRHLVVDGDVVRLGSGPRENGHRPSLDVLLCSAALTREQHCTGLVLTGMLDDGAAGLLAVARYGGTPLVQDPEDAEFASMPLAALAAVPDARRAPLPALAGEVARAVTEHSPVRPAVPQAERRRDEAEVRAALGLEVDASGEDALGPPSPFSCPDCGGVLNTLEDGSLLRYRCRVGHAYGAETLLEAQDDTIEDALFTALRALEERAEVADRLATSAGRSGRDFSRGHFRQRSEQARRSAEVLRRLLNDSRTAPAGSTEFGSAVQPAPGS